jgi:hypothetical protein
MEFESEIRAAGNPDSGKKHHALARRHRATTRAISVRREGGPSRAARRGHGTIAPA